MTSDMLFFVLGVCVVVAPAALLLVLGISSLFDGKLSESAISLCTQISVVVGLVAALVILAMMLIVGTRHVPIELGNWVVLPEHEYHFRVKFVFDRLSVPFVILTFVLCGTIGAFTSSYLHREPGYRRFFLYYSIFQLGMIVTSLAGTIETLFAGWELVGLSSALLVAFFQERTGPVRNGFRVWVVYRVADAALLVAAVALHHVTGAGDFEGLMGTGPWPEGQAFLSSSHAFAIGGLLLVAAAGKSALIPFSGWLPRAMEGPTPSSAVFYGSLSVHLGAFLLLRISPILELSLALRVLVVVLGLGTAIFAAFTSRVQTDIKSALAFASLTQVGIIVAEIGLGLRYVALAHIIGHACLRTLQLLRAPALLHDYRSMENAIGERLDHGNSLWQRILPAGMRLWLYRFSLERGFLDTIMIRFIVQPFVRLFEMFDRFEQRWMSFLAGKPVVGSTDSVVELPTTEDPS